MSVDFHSYLKEDGELLNMPPVIISKRDTDAKIVYNKNLGRLDYIAGTYYQDDTLSKIIVWANPEYDLEFDIPDNTIIRIPQPIDEVLKEVIAQILEKKDLY